MTVKTIENKLWKAGLKKYRYIYPNGVCETIGDFSVSENDYTKYGMPYLCLSVFVYNGLTVKDISEILKFSLNKYNSGKDFLIISMKKIG